MDTSREDQLSICRQVLFNIMKPKPISLFEPLKYDSDKEASHSEPVLIHENSFLKRWRAKDKLFEGKYSSGSNTPTTPRTPVTNYERRLRAVQSMNIKKSRQEWLDKKPKLFKSLGNEDEFLGYADDLNLCTPPLSLQNSYMSSDENYYYDTEDEEQRSRFENDFEELDIIGTGDFGTVYRCKHRIDGLLYAVKQVKITHKSKYSREAAIQEALTLAASNMYEDNAYIVRYHSVWIEEDYLYLSMELCDCSLTAYVERTGDLSEDMLRSIMRNVCKGLKKLHSHNIVHLDIKGENILFSFSHKFKLGDLGLSRITTNLKNDVPEGDARYLAPEMLDILSENIPDLTKADIFSLGATIYEIIRNKKLPSHGPEWHDIREGRLEIPGDFSQQFKTTLKRMLSKDPTERPSAEELLSTILMSKHRLELKRYRNYTKFLEDRLEEMKSAMPYKRRRLSL